VYDGFFGNCFLLKFGGSLHLNKEKNISYVCVWKIAGKTDNLFYIVPLLLMYAFVWDAIFHFARVQSLDGFVRV
jgi:hypothetical protein